MNKKLNVKIKLNDNSRIMNRAELTPVLEGLSSERFLES